MQDLTTMAERRPAGWLSRATIAGFIALGLSTVALVVAFFLTGAIGELYRGSNTFTAWMYELANNPIVERGRTSLLASLALHMVFGLFWAVVYGLLFEPRLRQYPGWQAGMIFSLLPYFLSLSVFLPISGGGLFGSALGAGPLPLVGNLILHLIYGAALGAVYGAGADRAETAGDTEAEEVRRILTLGRAEASAARGIVIGGSLGAVAGVLFAYAFPAAQIDRLVGSWPLAMGVAGMLSGAAVGALVGSLMGLTDPAERSYDEPPSTGLGTAAALIPLGVVGFVALMIVTLGSALLTVGDVHHFGKRQGYDQAIILGLSVLAVIVAGATILSWGSGRSRRRR
jgi:hypothetical protein